MNRCVGCSRALSKEERQDALKRAEELMMAHGDDVRYNDIIKWLLRLEIHDECALTVLRERDLSPN